MFNKYIFQLVSFCDNEPDEFFNKWHFFPRMFDTADMVSGPIMLIIFWDFLKIEQTFFSPQLKRRN